MPIVTSASQNLPDCAELAETLQATAQDLLAFASLPAATKKEAEPPVEEKAPSEIRSFHIPGFIVDEERKLLELLNAENWQEMFHKTYEQLYTQALLMQHFEADEAINGFSIQLMGNTLMAPLDILNRLCSLIADFHPVAEDNPDIG